MPEGPDITGSIGADATDKAIAAAKQAQLNAIRAETKLIEQRVQRAQIKSSGSISGPSDEVRARQIQSHINEVQSEHTKKAAESSEKFTVAVGAATTVLTALAHAVAVVNEAQSEGSSKTNDTRIRRGQAMRDLGFTPAEVKAAQERAESGAPLAGNISPTQEVQLLEAAASARSNARLPASLSPRADIKRIIGSDASFQEKLAALQNPIVPGVEFDLRGQGRTGLEATAGKAAFSEAILSASQASAEADAADAGLRTRGAQLEIQNEIRRGSVGGHAAALTSDIPIVGPAVAGIEAWLMKIHDKMPVQKPPSTNAGRE